METTKQITHTPGPWDVNNGDGIAIAKVSHFAITAPCAPNIGSGLSHEENEANAYVIASAPELLKHLKLAQPEFCSMKCPSVFRDSDSARHIAECLAMQDAIAKAEGRPPRDRRFGVEIREA